MGKRSDFKRRAQDAYDTPPEAVKPLVPHLPEFFSFLEPCAGAGDLADHIRFFCRGAKCQNMLDIAPRSDRVEQLDTLNKFETRADFIITNPPWTREILHPMILNFSGIRPTWLLFDADWMHTKQSIEFLPLLRKVVSVGRVSWMQNGVTGKDNCAWYLFDAKEEGPTEFVGRAA